MSWKENMLEKVKQNIVEQAEVENDSGINKKLLEFRKKIIDVLKTSDYPEKHPAKWDALKTCCQQVHAKTTCTCGDTRTYHAKTCKNKLCPICSHNKAQKRANTNLLRLKYLQHTQPDLNYFFATFTIKPGERFKPQYDILTNGLKEIKRRKYFSENILGGINNIEAVIGKNSKQWHIHCHSVLISKSTWLNHEDLKEDWQKITGANVIELRRIKKSEIDTGQIKECFKYPFKMHEIEDETGNGSFSINKSALIEFANNSSRLKFYNTFGCIRGEAGKAIKSYEKAMKNIEESAIREMGFDEQNPPCPTCLKPVRQLFYEISADGAVIRTSVPFDNIISVLAQQKAQNKTFLIEYIKLTREELPSFEVLIKLKKLITKWRGS